MGITGSHEGLKEEKGWGRSLGLELKVFPPLLHDTGEWTERGEGWPPSGSQHDPPGRQHPDGQGGDGDQTPRHGRGCPQERYIFTALTLAVSWRAGPAHTEPWAPAPRLQEGTLWCPPAILALGEVKAGGPEGGGHPGLLNEIELV